MNEEGSLFDVPPAAIGRYRVRQPLGAGTTGPAFHGETPDTRASVAIKLFKVDLSPDAAHELAQALNRLIDQMPEHEALATPLDAAFDEIEAYFVTGLIDGTSLDEALRDFGPSAIEDLVPRLQSLAGALDAAHHVGLVHGALHPRDILVSAETTHVTGVGVGPVLARAGVAWPVRRPYGAPETAAGGRATAESDQFSLAAIAFEWLFGRRISGPAERPIEVRALPGVDRRALATAFTTALAAEPDARFESCTAFCQAVASAVDGNSSVEIVAADEEPLPLRSTQPVMASLLDDPEVGPLQPEDEPEAEDEPEVVRFPPEYDAPMVATEPARVESRFESMAPTAPARSAERFGGGALVATLLVGLGFGFAAGYMAKPRALQNPPLAGSISAGGRPASTGSGDAGSEVAVPVETPPAAPEPARVTPAKPAPAAPSGSLLVRSTPSGASVVVDGVPRGRTPLALRELELKAWNVVVTERGFIPEERRVVLTPARPSRSLEVRLGAASPTAPATPAPPIRAPASAVGTLVVESRPSGAAVTINGQPRGTTPLTLDQMAPGEYDVRLALQGYRPFSTTVRVVPGERVRAAGSLSAQERE